MVDLSVNFAGINFKNPLIAASATPTRDAKRMKKAINAGFAGVVAKSLFGNSASLGRKYPRPRFKLFGWKEYPKYPEEVPNCFTLNSLEECSHFGYEDYVADINEAKKLIGDDGVVIASISGGSLDEWEELCDLVNSSKADMCEINISCPFAADLGIKMGAGAVELAPEIVKVIKKNLSLPFSVKLSPQVSDLLPIALNVEKAGANALTLQARLSGMIIDIETMKPMGWGSLGGYGGPYLIGYGLKWVSRISPNVKIPISAVLGVWAWEDIIRYVLVGATTVQSAAAVMLRGYHVARIWLNKITKWMDEKGYETFDEIRGAALKNIKSTKDVERKPSGVYVKIDETRCIGCAECIISCFYDAITMVNGKAQINQEKCDVCGMCVEKCPTNAARIFYEK
ncbi:MAG: 4Fe-4S binding protein [Candidatus Odinarchaeia archaeon]